MGRVMAMVCLILVLGACGRVPKPFAHSPAETGNPLLTLKDGLFVVVDPMSGLPPETNWALALALTDALRKANIPATTDDLTAPSYSLHGRAVTRGTAGARSLTLAWTVSGPDGATLGQVSRNLEPARATVLLSGRGPKRDAALARLAPDVAADIAPLLQDPMPVAARPPQAVRVAVAPVRGAPGDGNEAIGRAVRRLIGAAGLEAVDGAAPADVVLEGTVATAAPHDGRELITVSWSVRRPDGPSLGTVRQRNAVPEGSLDIAWGDTATAVAAGGVKGLVNLLDRLGIGPSPQ